LGNNIWAVKIVELNKAPITLAGIKLHRVSNSTELFQTLLSIWIKDFKKMQVYNYLYGTRIGQSVQIGLNIGSGVIDLIRIPVEEYNKGGNILKGIGLGATSLAQKLTVELLNIGASSAITVKKGLNAIDKAFSSKPSEVHISAWANQPQNITQGIQQAALSLKNGFEKTVNEIYSGGISSFPKAIMIPAITSAEAFSNITLGLRNNLDQNAYQSSQEKYKSTKENKEQ